MRLHKYHDSAFVPLHQISSATVLEMPEGRGGL
jgi:hypothetical protein